MPDKIGGPGPHAAGQRVSHGNKGLCGTPDKFAGPAAPGGGAGRPSCLT